MHHWDARFHDWIAGAVAPAVLALTSMEEVELELKIVVLVLTIAFFSMGIVLRWRKMVRGKDEDGRGRDDG